MKSIIRETTDAVRIEEVSLKKWRKGYLHAILLLKKMLPAKCLKLLIYYLTLPLLDFHILM